MILVTLLMLPCIVFCKQVNDTKGKKVTGTIKTVSPDFTIRILPDTIICFGTTTYFETTDLSAFVQPTFVWIKNDTVADENRSIYILSSLRNGDSVKCKIIDGGHEYYSNTIRITVLGIKPLVHIAPDDYACTAATATYASLIDLGNELDDLSAGTVLIPSGKENAVSEVIQLPFNFSFGGSVFNSFSVSVNGRMVFGNTAVDTGSNNTDAFSRFSIMPWWDKLTTGNNGAVKYKFFVEKEFTKLVIEWNANSSDIATPYDRKFQLRLVQEGSIIFLYKSSPAAAGTGSATIGIAGSNTDYQSVNLQSAFDATTISTASRFDNNTWLNNQYNSGRGVAFFNYCGYDSIIYGTPKLFRAFVDTLVPNPVFQWQKNGLPVGSNSTTYMDSTLMNSDVITCLVQSSTSCSTTSAVSNIVTVNVKPGTYIAFTGNGNWSNPANWSSGQVPPPGIAPGTAIVINPVAGGQCILDNPVVFSKGAQLIIKPGSNFIVGNNLTIQH